ncbi:MAG: hypothetical protein HUU50_14790 [Candidatus Brocadiae bacterium]|nr:hypothetical protein [Candidatus Brocadiia bacterium]
MLKKIPFLGFLFFLFLLLAGCSEGGSGEEEPVPEPVEKNLYALWGTGDGIFFAAGTSGSMQKYDGLSWKEEDTHTSFDLYSIWGISHDSVFAVGQAGAFLHYDGVEWKKIVIPMELKTQPFYGVWGISEKDIYIVGGNGRLLHYDGIKCTPIEITNETLYGIWGIADKNIFVVGEKGSIWKYSFEDNIWQREISGTAEDLYSVFGVWEEREYCIYAVGANGTILCYKNDTWIWVGGVTSVNLRSVWCSSSYDVFCVGQSGVGIHFNGNEWSLMSIGSSKNLYAVHGIKNSHVFITGEKQDILYHDLWDSFLELSLLPWKIQKYGEYPVSMEFEKESRIRQFQLIWDDSLGSQITLVAKKNIACLNSVNKGKGIQKVLFCYENIASGPFVLSLTHEAESLGHALSIQLKVYKYNHVPDRVRLSFLPGRPYDLSMSPLHQKLLLPQFSWNLHSEYPTFSIVTEKIIVSPVWHWVLEDYTPAILDYPCSIQISRDSIKKFIKR